MSSRTVSTPYGKKVKQALGKVVIFIIVLTGALAFVLPFIWMLSSSLKAESKLFTIPPQWIPSPVKWDNFIKSLTVLPFQVYYRNTAIITVSTIIGDVFTAALVAYGFARFRFRGRNVLFILVLSTIMLPPQVTIIPRFILFRWLKWIDTFVPIILPAYLGGSAFYIFLLRQFFLTIPRELDDAAKIDGLGPLRIFTMIILPMSKPALAIIAIFSFLFNWNDFWHPLVFLSSEEHYTVALGLYSLQGHFFSTVSLLMAAAVMAMLPCLVLFFLAQKYFIQGVVITGVKG
jgi:ABC-type glycerol-3-phosphate transport system permease component